jgi:hypothetical protein
MNHIQGEKFYSVADQLYSPNIIPEFDDYNLIHNTFEINALNEINIIYTHTLYVRNLFNEIKNLKNKFIVVTHNSDINVDQRLQMPSNVVKWFAQNVNVIDNRIESIPIGLPNNRWHPDIDKIRSIVNEQKNVKNLLYVNHKIKTNVIERQEPYDLFSNKNWATLAGNVDYNQYVNNIYNHKFVLCPNGNGIDTHRLWECLYVRTIPIVKNNINNSFYRDLPICLVNGWSEINPEFLESEYDRIINMMWCLDKLDFDYWKNKIINTKKHEFNRAL